MGIAIKLTSHKSEVLSAEQAAVLRGMEMIGMQGEGYAKEALTRQKAVDTGRLRNSVTYAGNDKEVVIGTNVEYAAYVELGTSKMSARPYLRPAAANHAAEYRAILQFALSG